jgi:hypothetical protein
MRYAGPWAYAWCGLVGIGDGLAVVEWSPLVAGLSLVLVSGCAAVAFLLVRLAREDAGGSPAVGSSACLSGSSVVALVAVADASPVLALLLVLLAGLSCPPAVRWAGRWLARPRPAPVRAPVSGASRVTTDGVVRRLGDGELCVLWRRTFWQLRSLQTPEAILATVLLRQALLDELARRNPVAVHAWLESGGRASGGPERFWDTGHPHGDAKPDL